ncbi:transporter [Nisaea acidiphila]|uniref:Transporter n=1 Tax=Nisaea acidiphila TaxID=1862145 RepID=A0A9J7AMT9_9PROT|nr:transporter [Nisaea acidiphila]UUX48487.1 transporter [Nisaea acidiphila]
MAKILRLSLLRAGAAAAVIAGSVHLAGAQQSGHGTHNHQTTGHMHEASGDGTMNHGHGMAMDSHGHPLPIGVMGARSPMKGRFMLGARVMEMKMDELLRGSDGISPEEAATSVANPFAPPATVRMVPTEMTTRMAMVSAMYGVTDDFGVMAMVPYVEKEMTMVTFSGMSGSTRLGENSADSSGLGDVKVGGTYTLYRSGGHRIIAVGAVSLPTGSIEETGRMLMANGMYMTRRLPYGMQLGSGTVDFLPGLTYTGASGKLSWGAQYKAVLRMQSENSEDYRLGNIHHVTGWLGYRVTDWFQATGRLVARTEDVVHGQDPNISGAAIGANPDNYGSERIGGLLGFNITPGNGLRVGAEAGLPLYERVNGTRLGASWSARLGVTYMF